MSAQKKTRAGDFDFHERLMAFARARMRDRRASDARSDARAIRTDARRRPEARAPGGPARALRPRRGRRPHTRTQRARDRGSRSRLAVDRIEPHPIDRRTRAGPARATPTRDAVVTVADRS